jgi:L-iditol 2-dehydrogenase
MKANVLYGINDLRFEDAKMPILEEGYVLMRVKACGICGSDVSRVFTNGTYHFPTIIGHEFSGVIESVFSLDDKDMIGKPFSVFPLIPCGKCDCCKQGKYEMCAHYNYLGSRCNGGFAEFVAVPKWNLIPIPDSVSFIEAAMLEPAAVALHALKKSELKIGDSIAIFGPGTIGMILSQLAIIAGAKKVFLVGRSQEKLDYAKAKIGIRYICNSTKVNVLDFVNKETRGQGVDVSVEGTGASMSMDCCFDITRPSGIVVAMGNPLDNINLKKECYWKLLRKQLSIHGTWNSSFGLVHDDWNEIFALLRSKKLNLTGLVTHRFPLSDLKRGLDIMKDPCVYSNKVMIVNE